jgi:uncharacterized RDD family membrane protein YckC
MLILRRVAAFAIDLAIFFPALVGGVLLARAYGFNWQFVDSVFLFLLACAYFGCFEGAGRGSPGKRLLKLRVTFANGESLTPYAAVLRAVVFFSLPSIVLLTFDLAVTLVPWDITQVHWAWSAAEGGATTATTIIPLSILLSGGTQGLHDLIAGTVVSRAATPRARMFSAALLWSTSTAVALILALLAGRFWVSGFVMIADNFGNAQSQRGPFEETRRALEEELLGQPLALRSLGFRQYPFPADYKSDERTVCRCDGSTTVSHDAIFVRLASIPIEPGDFTILEQAVHTVGATVGAKLAEVPWSRLEVEAEFSYTFGPLTLVEGIGIPSVRCTRQPQPRIQMCPRTEYWQSFAVAWSSSGSLGSL